MTANPEEGAVEEDVYTRLLNKRIPKAEETETEEEPPEEEATLEEVEEENVEEEPTDEETEVVDSEEDQEEFEEEQETYTIKVDGEEVDVTLDELLKVNMLERDYRKKTATLSDEKKALEAEKERVNNYLSTEQQVVQELEILKELNSKPFYSDQQLLQILEEKGEKPYLKAKAAEEKRQKDFAQIRERIEGKKNTLTEEQERANQQLAAQEHEALKKAIPEVLEPEGQRKLIEHLTNFGFTPEQIETTSDHRLFVMAEESRKYREMMAKTKVKTSKKPPKVLKRKARKDNSSIQDKKMQDLKKRAARTGDAKDMRAYLLAKKQLK